MSLIEDLRANDKKGIFNSSDQYDNYSTGFLPIDYANGFWQGIESDSGVSYVPVPGVLSGHFISIIGATQGGKSTLADQIAYSIISPHENGYMEHVDCEKTTLMNRLYSLTGAYKDPRIVLNKEFTSIEDTLEKINTIAKLKEEGGKKFMYEVKNRTFDGRAFLMYVPTVIIIDSLPYFNSKEMKVEEMDNNMAQARAAKNIGDFVNKVHNTMYRYNIIVIVVNHIRAAVNIDPYSQPPRGILLLKNGETLIRGSSMQYMTATCIRLDTTKSNAYTIEDDGFQGYRCTIQLAKSKTNVSGTALNMTLNTDIGFDPIYTIYEFSSQFGLLDGRNPYLYYKGFEATKFNRKEFRSKFISDESFRKIVMAASLPYMESLLGEKESFNTGVDFVKLTSEFMTTAENSAGVISKQLIAAATSTKRRKK